MYLIDGTYFIRENSIPNLQELNGNDAELIQFIDEKVPSLLSGVLGIDNFDALNSQITEGVLNEDADQKWKDLVNGVSYHEGGITKKWNGLIYEFGTFKGSLLADYIFYEWLKYKTSSLSGTGEVILNAKNAENVNSSQRLIESWNRFYVKVVGYFGNKPHKYWHNGVRVIDYLGSSTNGSVSLFTFLQDNNTTYENCSFILPEVGVKNSFGL